jgi:type VI secretion system (T6SS) effector TldE1-like protein
MSTSTGAFGFAAASRKKSSRKVLPHHFFGSAAIAGLVVGCAWTVYTNILTANVYPPMDSAAYEAPVVKREPAVATRSTPSFNEVFASLPPPPPTLSKPEPGSASIMFNERFAAAAPEGVASRAAEAAPPAEAPRVAEAPKPATAAKLAEAKSGTAPKGIEAAKKEAAASLQVALNTPTAPVDTKPAAKSSGASVRDMAARAKAAVMSIASGERQSIVEKLWGKHESSGSLLSFASADANVTASIPSTLNQNPMNGGSPPYDRQTAVYDISAAMVYLPDGTRLEAHSGLGSKLDDVRYASVRMQGVTPPHIYELKPREALFHGVPALRLTPIGGEDKIYGRAGLLAHTYMLGPNGDSNGCVSFKNYYAFLDAYRNKGIRRLAVLAKVQ